VGRGVEIPSNRCGATGAGNRVNFRIIQKGGGNWNFSKIP
jgi:hypothetical protein